MVGITRRSFFQGLAGIAGCPIAHQARAQSGYPAGLTVKFIVGFPAGGAQDIVGRVIADRLGALWKVPHRGREILPVPVAISAWTGSPKERATAVKF